MDCDDKIQALSNKFNTQIDNLRNDIRFHQVALNLSGNREILKTRQLN